MAIMASSSSLDTIEAVYRQIYIKDSIEARMGSYSNATLYGTGYFFIKAGDAAEAEAEKAFAAAHPELGEVCL